jgi:anti-sigma factor RsiW
MNCREVVELLIDFVSGELTPERRLRLEQHLQLCPPCLAYLQTYRLTIQLTRRLPRHAPPPPQLVERLHAALKGAPPKPPPAAGGLYAG